MYKIPLGLYVHIPFCERKCNYCGFLSYEGQTNDTIKEYVSSLIREIHLYKKEFEPMYETDSIFIGGGTPSILDAEDAERLMGELTGMLDVPEAPEFTIEANPNSLDSEKLQAYRRSGVNRISLGVQSFNDRILQSLGRLHTAREAENAFDMIKQTGPVDVNIDLMFGVPGQTMEDWKKDLDKAIELDPEHISFYSLQLEEGTPFYENYRTGKMDLPDDDTERKMYHYAVARLEQAGYDHYEISNCAKPGRECIHNIKYWDMADFLGLGAGASSYINGARFKNCDEISKYIWLLDDGQMPLELGTYHIDSRKDQMAVFCFTALRKMEGIDLDYFEIMFDTNFFKAYRDKAETILSYSKEGLLTISDTNIALTEKGIDRSNEIMSEFV
ncbi:MAG: radical SAM family heme chaperone HemW [Eubacteriaceae bacterium]|nr:radical SAM family heme chaperone HemW [Eubacteriaceae bacterium]